LHLCLLEAQKRSDTEQLARGVAEDQLSQSEKEKTMLQLEMKDMLNRHKSELARRELSINNVSPATITASSAAYVLAVLLSFILV